MKTFKDLFESIAYPEIVNEASFSGVKQYIKDYPSAMHLMNLLIRHTPDEFLNWLQSGSSEILNNISQIHKDDSGFDSLEEFDFAVTKLAKGWINSQEI